MSETLRDLVVSLSLQSDNFTRNIKSVNKQIQEAESYFKLAAAGVEGFEHTTEGLSTQLSTLERRLSLQKDAVSQYEKALSAANTKLTECYNRQTDYAVRLETARRAHQELKEQVAAAAREYREYARELSESDDLTIEAKANLDALKEQYRESAQNVRLLAGQNTALRKSTQNAADAVTTAQTNLNKANAAVKQTEASLEQCNAELALSRTQWEQAGNSIRDSQTAITGIGRQMQLAQSQYAQMTAGLGNSVTSVDLLTAKMGLLEQQYRLQSQTVAQYESILESARAQLAAASEANDPARVQQASDAILDAQIALSNANAELSKTETELNDCNAALDLANHGWDEAAATILRSEQSLNSINKQLRVNDSYYKYQTAGIENIESSYRSLIQTSIYLEDRYELQQRAVSELSTAYQAARDQLAAAEAANNPDKIREATDAVADAEANLYSARTALIETEYKIDDCNKALELARTDWFNAGEGIKQAHTKLTTIGKQLKQAESRFKLATAGIKDMDTSVEGLSAKLTLLKDKLKLQEKSVIQYKKALSEARVQLQAAQEAHDPEKIQQASDAVIDAKTSLNEARAAVKQTKADIDDCNKSLKTAQSAWTAAGKSLESFSKKCDNASKIMNTVGRTLTTVMTTPIIALGAAAVKASISYESAFTSVRKTVDATEEEFAHLSDEIKGMSTVIATSADDIAEVVAIAGQLGIANDYLTDFARTMIDLGNSTDIVASEASSTLAKFANITNMDQSMFQNLGSALVDLGNNYATTESAIMEMAMRLAAAGHQVGLSEAQILGFATALSSVGIEAQMGGSAFSKALVKMEVAAETGGEALDDFAKVSGMTAEEFKQLWDADPAGAFQAFIVGLSKMDEEGMSAIATLNEIGIVEVRLRDTLLRAVNATELFSETQETANRAWEENTALTEEAGKRYATTASKLTNLKNKAVLFGQQIGDDLNPTIQELIEGADDLLDKFMGLDEAQRLQIIKFAAIAAASGPVLLGFSKITKGISVISSGISKFSLAVGKAGGGFKGFMSVIGKSPAVWFALAAATVTACLAIQDYVSGAKKAREALEGMMDTAEKWKNTAADTFYGKSEGLSFFGMSESDFQRNTQSAEEWLSGLLAVWTDGQKETDEIVSHWTDSFKTLTAATRTELEEMKATADAAGYTMVSDGLAAGIATLDALDAEVEALLKKRQNGLFTEEDQIRLNELIDTREAIEVKYKLSPADVDGFDTIQQKLDAEIARAHARGQSDADISVYENAMVAAAEGLAAANAEIDAQYDKEYELIQLIEDAGERQIALDALNSRYNEDRRNAAMEYANLMAGIVMPVWEQADIQQAASDVDLLTLKLREYSAASESERPAILEDINELTAGMDEGALTEYIALLMQIQSLLDSGMTEAEVQALFPEIDFTTALDQIAAIQAFLNNREVELPGLNIMFGEALPEELVTIATDLDMTGAQARWDEFAANPGAITTDAVVASYDDQQALLLLQPQVDAFVAKYTEIPEGASTAELTPTGMIAYVTTYAEVTTGADVSGLTPENVTAMVSAYDELAAGCDISLLKPDEIVAYVSDYCEAEGVDISALGPKGVTAFVMAYEEITGGAITTALQPTDVVAMVCKYLEAEGIDISALSPDQVEAIVSSFAEATGCDKSQLLQDFTATIVAYDDTNAVKPTLSITVGITGYDMIAYRDFVDNNPVDVQGIVRLGEVYEDPTEALEDPAVTFWQDGVEVPISAVPTELLTVDKVAVLAEDGTMHVFITPELTGSPEAIESARASLDTAYTYGDSIFGKREIPDDSPLRYLAIDTFDLIKLQTQTLRSMIENDHTFSDLWGLFDGAQINAVESRLAADFDPTRIGEITAYVTELLTALQNGEQLAEEDMAQLQGIIDFLEMLELTGTGENIRAGIAEGMTAAGWETDAETVAANLETALNTALGIESPSTRVKPVGEYVSAGVGVGMSGYDFTTDAASVATAIQTALTTALTGTLLSGIGTTAMSGLSGSMTGYSMAGTGSMIGANVKSSVSANLNSTSLRSIGVNAMAGLRAGIVAGRSGVISAMRSAARAAVNAAKAELDISSPSRVFEDEVGAMTMQGFGRGVLKETKEQARIIQNASRFLTEEAREGAIAYSTNDNRRTYNNSVNSTIQVQQMVIRDEQDIRSLAVEIATLTRRQQRGKGLRMA